MQLEIGPLWSQSSYVVQDLRERYIPNAHLDRNLKNFVISPTAITLLAWLCPGCLVSTPPAARYCTLHHQVEIDLFNFLIGLLQNTTMPAYRPLQLWCANTRDRDPQTNDKFICITPLTPRLGWARTDSVHGALVRFQSRAPFPVADQVQC